MEAKLKLANDNLKKKMDDLNEKNAVACSNRPTSIP
jgi:hypothetical protein